MSDLRASRLRLFGFVLLCAKVALVPVVFDYNADFPFPVAKGLLSHALVFSLAGVLLALAVRYGRSFWVWSWIHVPVLAFIAANAVATVFARDPLVALYGTHGRMLGLGTLADFVTTYFAVVLLVRTRRDGIATVASFLASSVVVLAYEAVQFVGKDPFDWNVTSAVRPFSTLGQTTTLAEYLTALFIGALAIALFDEALRPRFRAVLLMYSVLLLAGVLVTQTRSALLGVVGGVVALLTLTFVAHPSRRARIVSIAGAAFSAAAVAALLVFTPLGARFLTTVEVPGNDVSGNNGGARLEQSAEVRIALYAAAVQMVRDRPVFGYGPDNFSAAFPSYRSDSEPFEVQQSLPTSAHGWAAQIAATSGLVGLASFLGIAVLALVLTVRSGFRPIAWAALAVLVAFLGAGLTTVSDLGVDWLFWCAAGAIAVVTSTRPEERSTTRRDGQGRALLALSFVGLGLLLGVASVSAYGAARSAHDSQVQRLAGKPEPAIQSALRATNADTNRAEYWDDLGLAYVSGQRLTDAVAAFGRAVSLAPYNVRILGDLASANLVLVQRGDAAAGPRARDVAERAVRADPNNPQAHLTRAVVMQVTGDLPEALRSVERALALDPSFTNPRLDLTATQVLNASGRTGDAIAIARRAIGALDLNDTVQIRVELARALLASGQPAQALTELDAALVIRPNDPAALQLRAQIRAGATQ